MKEDLIEMEISSQVSKDGWKLIKKYKNIKNNHYALIECEKCKEQKLVNYYNFINTKTKTLTCPCRHEELVISEVGKTYGSVKVLELDHIEYIQTGHSHYNVYFKTQCTKCNKISIRLFNKNQWKVTDGCKSCNAEFTSPSLNDLFRVYKNSANYRNISWDLTGIQFLDIISKNCIYCGNIPEVRQHDRTRSKEKEKVNGIDRIDSSKGYTIENCVPCCTMCNYMKQSYSQLEFLNQIDKIYHYQKEKGSTTIPEGSTSK